MNLDLEFEGDRAFAVWDRVPIGNYEFKARLELDPKLLEKVHRRRRLFIYHGEINMPQPQEN